MSHANAHEAAVAKLDVARLPQEQGKKVRAAGLALAVVGIALAGAAAAVDPHRFAYSYLTGFLFVLTLGLGGLLFVLCQHLTRSGWSVATRRPAEWLAGVLPLCALLFIPVAVFASTIYEEWWPGADKELVHNHSYLNPTFWYVRAVVFFVFWGLSSWYYLKTSLKQDESGDAGLTTKLQVRSAVLTLFTVYTLTFAAFDWIMSLDPHWFSTIFGVYIFAGSVVSALAFLALVTILFQQKGLLNRVFNVEHQYVLGKLFFAFIIFYAYIAFVQYFLIWYGNIPEETVFFKHRWDYGTWKELSLVIIFGMFIIPFTVLLPRTVKKSRFGLGAMAVLILVSHYVDMYWLVMPTLDTESAHFTWIDVAGLLAPVGVLCAWLGHRLARDPIYPLKDPRIPETLRVDNG